jgi:chaperonin GroEL
MIEMGIIDPPRGGQLGTAERRVGGRTAAHHKLLVAEEQTPRGGSAALMTEFGPLDEGLRQPSPDSGTPRSMGMTTPGTHDLGRACAGCVASLL